MPPAPPGTWRPLDLRLHPATPPARSVNSRRCGRRRATPAAQPARSFYFLGQEEWTAERLATLPSVDAVIRLSKDLAQIGIYPTIDPLASQSRLLDTGLVGPEHVEIVARVRKAAAADVQDLKPRARGLTPPMWLDEHGPRSANAPVPRPRLRTRVASTPLPLRVPSMDGMARTADVHRELVRPRSAVRPVA